MSDELRSSNGRFRLVCQSDGNLVLYDRTEPIWDTGTLRPEPVPDPLPPPPPVPMIRVAGTTFRDARTDTTWKLRGCSAFSLFYRYLIGEDVRPFCAWARSRHINTLRIFSMYCGKLGRLVPYEHPDYYPKLATFLRLMETEGLTVELVAFADMGALPLRLVRAPEHYATVITILRDRPGVLLEVCNEPFANAFEPLDVYAPFSGVVQALGHYDVDGPTGTLPHAEYLTQHGGRDHEWPRRAKDLLELSRLGYDDDPDPTHAPFAALNIPAIGDEPMGIGPEEPGRRSMVASDHAAYHALAQLFASGSTIHGDFGLEGRLPTPAEDAVVRAIDEAWMAVPPACQTWTYTAGHLAGCPLLNDGLKTYGMIQGDHAVMVRVRPTADPVAINGWRILRVTGPVVEMDR